MNDKKIIEIVKSLGIIPEEEHLEIAKVIIKECIKVCDDGAYSSASEHNITAYWECGKDIANHFGIE